MRHSLKTLCLIALALWLAACQPTPLQQQEAYVFGTRVEVIVVSPEAEVARKAIASVLREFDRLHQTYHAWEPSALSELNSALAAGRPQEVTPEMRAFIEEAQTFSRQGDYLFDPGIGQLIKLWGFQASEFRAVLPDPADLARWRKEKPSIADVRIEGNRISSSKRSVALDFGGYLKGVALDRAAAILRSQGIHNALINIGGNILAMGSKAGKKWRVGIQHPRQSGPLATIELDDGEAIGTSGDYQRFFELDGKRYPHLIDPRTASPVDHTQAVTLVIPAGKNAGTLSDALSKPIFIAGPDAWRAMADQLGIGLVLRVDRDNHVFVTQALKNRMEFIGQPPEITVVQ